jgi:putative hydrolase of the HAD superfamily
MTERDRRFRAVFFDLDETLLDDDRGMRESVTDVCATLGQRYPAIDARELEDTYLRVSDEVWRSEGAVPRAAGSGNSNGREIRVEVWGKALASYGLLGRPLAIEAAELYSEERRGRYRLFPDARVVLDALHRRMILGVITNGPGDTQREKLAVSGVQAYLDFFCSSGELGVGKPEAAIFHEAMAAARVTSDEALHVGDSLAADIAGAQGVGIATAWINRRGVPRPPDAPRPDIEISSLRDLIPVVGLPG